MVLTLKKDTRIGSVKQYNWDFFSKF